MTEIQTATIAGTIQLLVLSTSEWIIAEPPNAWGATGTYLGFIQQLGERFEVTMLTDSAVQFATAASLKEAVGRVSQLPHSRWVVVD